jgi:tRNA1(Val) A37 N6-methylase TrmN6
MPKNTQFTFNYFQPDEYRFSLDSVFLAQKVASLIKDNSNLSHWRTLDLCAGCGIIGLELSLHSPQLKKIDFLEVQESYREYFEKNVKMIYPQFSDSEFPFLNWNYQTLLNLEHFENAYDLIVSNPPYFFQNEGLLSPSQFKNRCRFFLDSDFETLIKAVLFVLKPNAIAYLLVRTGTEHGRTPLNDIKKILLDRGVAEVIDNIRGTDIIAIRKEV